VRRIIAATADGLGPRGKPTKAPRFIFRFRSDFTEVAALLEPARCVSSISWRVIPDLSSFPGRTFRGERTGHFSRSKRPLEGVSIRTVCHIDTWVENFEAVHHFYDARREGGAKAESNLAHRTIAEWQKAWPGRTFILTQNIDRLLENAGCKDVIHLHGDIRVCGVSNAGTNGSWMAIVMTARAVRLAGNRKV